MENNIFTLREWQQLLKNPNALIVQASTKDGSDSWQPFPIGMCWQYLLNVQKGEKIQIGDHERLVLCPVNTHTDKRRRPKGLNRESIVNTLKAQFFIK